MRSPALLFIVVFAALEIAAEAPAHAQERAVSAANREAAAALKKQGDAAMVSLRYEEAIAAYTKAHGLTGDPALLYNRGRALQGLGRFPEALEELEQFKTQASPQLKSRVPALDELIAEVRAKVSVVTFRSNVKGARILVRSKVVGTTPLKAPLKLTAGSADVQVEADGFVTYRKTHRLPGGGDLTIDANLTSKGTTGILIVKSPTVGARVFVDGKSAGNVPVEVTVSAGTHKIVVEHEGYETAETSAIVAVGDRKQISIALDQSRPLTSRWYFWAGIGAVVVGGAVVTGALLTEGPASEGDIPPGQVSAPFRF